MKTASAFTLIELVVVIVILAILATVAIPRFYNFIESADKAVVKMTAGVLTDSIQMAFGYWLVRGQQVSSLPVVGPDDQNNFMNTLDYNNHGCPVQHWQYDGESPEHILNNVQDCITVWLFTLDRCKNSLIDCGYDDNPTWLDANMGDFEAAFKGNQVCEYSYRRKPEYKIKYDAGQGGCPVTTIGL